MTKTETLKWMSWTARVSQSARHAEQATIQLNNQLVSTVDPDWLRQIAEQLDALNLNLQELVLYEALDGD